MHRLRIAAGGRATGVASRCAQRAAALLALCACGPPPAAGRTPALPARDVQLTPVMEVPFAEVLVAHGALAAEEDLDLAFQHAGALAELRVDLGSRVRAGEVLARLDTASAELAVRVAEAAVRQSRVRLGLSTDGDDDAVVAAETPAVRQAQATLTEARLNLDRVQELVKQNLVAEAALETARAVHDVAEGRLEEAYNEVRDQQVALAQRRVETELARRRLIESALAAPVDGVVSARHVAPPEYVRAGDRVVTLLRTNPLRLRLRIPEREAGRVVAGQLVAFTAEGVAGEHRGRLVRLSPEIELTTRTLLVEAGVDNADGRLRPGLFTRASIEIGAPRPCLAIPAPALVTFAGVEKVFAVRDGRAVERLVRTGRRAGDQVEVVEGLQAGELVVAAPGDLVHGQPARVVER